MLVGNIGTTWIFSATLDYFLAEHKLKPFHGARVFRVGFPEEEEKHMTEVLLSNGGTVTNLEDPICTHVVQRKVALSQRALSQEFSPTQKHFGGGKKKVGDEGLKEMDDMGWVEKKWSILKKAL
ncbi:hypothetical protein NQ318_014336 [Aromia moschata]|uniref:Uncharacterized protein n=1 Tax=Aromia moschata TaxID=1265417 RepID=A0AAV8Z0L5_9CUCU|nr:hypothetical protein NQ318_014336 [Aromia moschata]